MPNKKKQLKPILDPFGISLVEDYDHLYKDFGIDSFEPFITKISNPSAMMRRKLVVGQRDFQRFLNGLNNHEEVAVMSGIKPTGDFHLGTLLTASEVIYFQKLGATAFYCIADIEAYEDNNQSFIESERIAVGNVADLLALGFDPKKGHIYRQSKETRVKDLAIIFGRKITLATMKAIYGERHMGLYISALIQAGDILLPQLREFGGPKPTIIPVGVDQDPHIRFTRDIAFKFRNKYGFVLPSATYHKLIKALDGNNKMSKRNPLSYFTLTENAASISEKINNAFTGGRATVEEQRRIGAEPTVCPIYDLGLFHFFEEDRDVINLYTACKQGKILCGEDKQKFIQKILKFAKEHQRKRARLIDKAREILEIA